MGFVTLADRIHAILVPRLEAFTKVDVFKDIKQTVSLEGQGHDVRGFHGRTTTLSIPFSDACPAKVQLSFRLGHDGPVENAIMDYRLEILPIFFKFESHDQLMIPISHPNEDAIAKWIEDRLVGFTHTFFELRFHNEYQSRHLETDAVMNIRFPKADAIGAALVRTLGLVGKQLDFLQLNNYLDSESFVHMVSNSPNTRQLFERVVSILSPETAEGTQPIVECALESQDFGWATGIEKTVEVEEAAKAFGVETKAPSV